ncbi:MAG: ABC transporter permease [Candidatus Heimdallarchaeota archaeon]|nr:ABC transporter permease [Candidatus Heimdallarchaeota archaeon]
MISEESIIQPYRISYTGKPVLWAITALGLGFYILGALFFLYGFLLITIDSFTQFINLGVVAIVSAFIVYILGKFIINRWGMQTLYVYDDYYQLDTRFGEKTRIDFTDLVLIKVIKQNPYTEILPLSSPTIKIITYYKVFNLNSIKFIKTDEMVEFFEEEAKVYDDIFAEFFHRSRYAITRLIFRFTQDTAGIIGLVIVLVFVFMALWGALAMAISPITPYYEHTLFLRNPEYLNFELEGFDQDSAVLAPPSRYFWFGTDFVGRDIFARLVFGTTFTFLIAIAGSAFAIFFILFFGITSAFKGGIYDNIVMRISDALLSFPPFIFLVVFSAFSLGLRAAIPGGFFLIVYIGISIVIWPAGARIIRAEIKEILETEFLLAAKQLGATRWTIFSKHVFPQIIPTVLILFTYQMTDIILGTTLLGFVGFGAESTLIWGSDLSHAIDGLGFLYNWWTVVFPTIFIFLLVFGLTLVSDSLRDNLDPRIRGGIKSMPIELIKELEL